MCPLDEGRKSVTSYIQPSYGICYEDSTAVAEVNILPICAKIASNELFFKNYSNDVPISTIQFVEVIPLIV